jgi:hypothetical protein
MMHTQPVTAAQDLHTIDQLAAAACTSAMRLREKHHSPNKSARVVRKDIEKYMQQAGQHHSCFSRRVSHTIKLFTINPTSLVATNKVQCKKVPVKHQLNT